MFTIVCDKCNNKAKLEIGEKLFITYNDLNLYDKNNQLNGFRIGGCGYDGQVSITCNKCGNKIEESY